MKGTIPRPKLESTYLEAAQRYAESLPLEHYMEAMPQGTQRRITLASLELVHARRPDIQYFNEMLVQYDRDDEVTQVVPDNMVVVWKEPLRVEGSYDIPLQPVGPFWMLEYVSKNSKRKDYKDNFDRYESEVKVPWLLLFYPEIQDLRLYHHHGSKLVRVQPNENERLAIPELEIEVAILDGWVRFWFRGELLPLPAELLAEVDEMKRMLANEKQRADRESQRAEQEAQRAQQEGQRAEHEAQRAEQEAQRADLEAKRAKFLEARLEAERKERALIELEMKRELDRLNAVLGRTKTDPPDSAP